MAASILTAQNDPLSDGLCLVVSYIYQGAKPCGSLVGRQDYYRNLKPQYLCRAEHLQGGNRKNLIIYSTTTSTN